MLQLKSDPKLDPLALEPPPGTVGGATFFGPMAGLLVRRLPPTEMRRITAVGVLDVDDNVEQKTGNVTWESLSENGDAVPHNAECN